MSALSVVSRLAEIAGLLSPVDGTLPEALDEARRLVTETLLNDQFEPMEDPSSPRSTLATINALPQKTLDDLRHIIDEVIP